MLITYLPGHKQLVWLSKPGLGYDCFSEGSERYVSHDLPIEGIFFLTLAGIFLLLTAVLTVRKNELRTGVVQ